VVNFGKTKLKEGKKKGGGSRTNVNLKDLEKGWLRRWGEKQTTNRELWEWSVDIQSNLKGTGPKTEKSTAL